MRILYAIICEDASDRQDGRLDAGGLFHQLYAPGFPAQQDRLVLALTIEWDQGETGRHHFKIDLLDPSRSPCLTINGYSDVDESAHGDAPAQTRLVMPLEDIVFPTAGRYEFELSLDGEAYPLTPLHLLQLPQAVN